MKNDYYESPKPSWLTKQFWRAAGADRYLLERSTYSDQIKYFCLGGIVTATGVMAALAGGYAFYTIFEPTPDNMLENGIHMPTFFISVVFAIIWGLIIYNIDRFIVTSTGKGDGTEAITKQEIKGAIPRIVMGMIIALTISKPLEIRMFQKEIEARMQEEKEAEIQKRDSLLTIRFEVSYLDDINKKQTEARAMKADLESSINDKDAEMKEEEAKCPPGSDNLCRGPYWRKLSQEREALIAQRPYIEEEMNSRLIELDTLEKEIKLKQESEHKIMVDVVNNMFGLSKKLQYAHEEAGWIISLFITLLFMVIELTPIFFKMMLIKGPYDYMDENVKELSRAELGIEIEYNFYTDREGLDKHKVVNHAAENKRREKLALLAAQDEMNKKIIEEWKKREMKKIEENPEDYINNG